MRLITAKEQKAIDDAWQQATGLPLLLLMEAAGQAAAACCASLARQSGHQRQAIIVCGPGQNGGDAWVCARILHSLGWTVICRELYPDKNLPQETAVNRQAAIHLGLGCGLPAESDFLDHPGCLIVDGIFGSGFSVRRGVAEPFRTVSRWISAARLAGSPVVAIDVPSGLDCDSGLAVPEVIQADRTVTFVRSRIGLVTAPGCDWCGTVDVAPIGIPDCIIEQVLGRGIAPRTEAISKDMLADWCPHRPRHAHKGMFGRVMVIAGSPGMPGAASLCAEAAGRTGCGLVQLLVPDTLLPAVLAARPECLLTGWRDGDELVHNALASISHCDAVAAGPGLGFFPGLGGLLGLLFEQASSLIVDADALNLIARDPEPYWKLAGIRQMQGMTTPVLTPHPGEFHRLAPDIDITDRRQAALSLASRSSCIVVLKGAATVVAAPDGSSWINTTGQDGLARGGSGDILCGLAAGLAAQGLSIKQAAVAAVFCHGLAADLAAQRLGRRAMLPADVLSALGSAWRAVGWEVEDV